MTDLVSKEAVIEAIRGCWRKSRQSAKPFDDNCIIDCMFAVKNLPIAANTASIVRCAYCKYCFDEDCETPYDGEDRWYCERWDRDTSAYGTDPYRFFCADGIRRGERENAVG